MERMGTITKYEEVGEGSALGRLHFWRIAFIMTADNPLGVGLRNYDHAYDDYDDSGGAFGRGRSVHNSHLQVMTEEGYAGFLIWLTMFGYALIACVRIRFGAAKPGLSAEDRQFYQSRRPRLRRRCWPSWWAAPLPLGQRLLTWMTFGSWRRPPHVPGGSAGAQARPCRYRPRRRRHPARPPQSYRVTPPLSCRSSCA
jgi:hypothetical protein